MARLADSGSHVMLDDIAVWYDTRSDTVHVTSSDKMLPPGGFHMTVKRGTHTDTSLRSLLEEHGVTAQQYEAAIPGQRGPIVLRGSTNIRQLRAALLVDRRFGFAQLFWSPGTSAEGIVTDDWSREGSLLITGDSPLTRVELLKSMLTQVVHKNGPTEVQVSILEPGSELGAYAQLDSVQYSGRSTSASSVAERLHFLLREIELREQLLHTSPNRPSSLEDARAGALDYVLEQGGRLAEHSLFLPYILSVIEGWETLVSTSLQRAPKQLLELVEQIVTRGPLVGVVIVISADRAARLGSSLPSMMYRVALHTTSAGEARALNLTQDALAGLAPKEGLLTEVDRISPTTRFHLHALSLTSRVSGNHYVSA